MSAADTEHGISHHFAPNQQWSFRQAAQRIANPSLTLSDLERCLDNNQRTLHTHFYHGNLTVRDLRRRRNAGLTFVNRITAIAERSLP